MSTGLFAETDKLSLKFRCYSKTPRIVYCFSCSSYFFFFSKGLSCALLTNKISASGRNGKKQIKYNPSIAKTILSRKSQVIGLILSDFTTYYTATVIKKV